jgi:hypothetical protein
MVFNVYFGNKKAGERVLCPTDLLLTRNLRAS